ncbi:MAG: porin, partial [Flavobacteriales bacterium]|nr:porin [Flavobacteriales bacterium]
ANKSTRTPIAKHASGTTTGDKLYIGSGINVQAGYIFRCNWEVAGRFTGIKPDVQVASPFEQYTLGLSRYIVGHKLKVQGDLTYKTKDNSPANMLEYRLQVDCHF